MKDYLTIDVTIEVHHTLEICVDDYLVGDWGTQDLLEFYARVRDNPMDFINKSTESTSEVGDIRHQSVRHETK